MAPSVVERLARPPRPQPQAVALGVDIVSDPHREDDDGYNWTFLGRVAQRR
ncbi:MAG TPA: hypothetical protein VE466_14730 [Acidimicrobiales bacterium]|nr:hypothetical protein [Acidimicrobiales bacterium]